MYLYLSHLGMDCIFLTGGIEIADAYRVGFDLVEVDIVSTITGLPSKTSIFIDKEHVDFVFVAETYDTNIQN